MDTGDKMEPTIEEMRKDDDFIKYMYKDYMKSKIIKDIRYDIALMMDDMKSMPNEDFIKKYEHPQRKFANMKWALYKAKNDLIDCKKCKTYHKKDGECIQLKRHT